MYGCATQCGNPPSSILLQPPWHPYPRPGVSQDCNRRNDFERCVVQPLTVSGNPSLTSNDNDVRHFKLQCYRPTDDTVQQDKADTTQAPLGFTVTVYFWTERTERTKHIN